MVKKVEFCGHANQRCLLVGKLENEQLSLVLKKSDVFVESFIHPELLLVTSADFLFSLQKFERPINMSCRRSEIVLEWKLY